jgi:hypothetical protein
MNNIINRPSLAILMDCWEYNESLGDRIEFEKKINNIIEFCASDQIQTIAISTYGHCSSQKTFDDSELITTSKNLFYNTANCAFIRNIWNSLSFENIRATYPDILSMPMGSDQIKFYALDTLQILYYCNFINTHIRNIYICGFAWDICIKYRPTGWLQLAALIKSNMFKNDMNILINTKCIGGKSGQESGFTPSPNLWDQIDNDIFCLNINSEYIFK